MQNGVTILINTVSLTKKKKKKKKKLAFMLIFCQSDQKLLKAFASPIPVLFQALYFV